jgi:hypothetical protein
MREKEIVNDVFIGSGSAPCLLRGTRDASSLSAFTGADSRK